MARGRNASPTQNGFLFQIDVAIYLMIKYILDINKIRVEGEKEDIEIELNKSKKIMVQVKSQWDNLDNKKNVISNLNSALTSLHESNGNEVSDLMYVSNFPDPLNNMDPEFVMYPGITRKKYSELQKSSKDVIDDKIKNIFGSNSKFDKNKLWIIRIPFYGSDEDEKHKFIYEIVKEFLNELGGKISYKNFVAFWESKFLRNGSDKPKIFLSKKDVSNYLVLTSIESYDASNDYQLLDIESDDYDEAYERYSDFIDEKQDCYEAICKVNSLYERLNKRKNITKEKFVQQEKLNLYNYFFSSSKNNVIDMNSEEKLDMLVAQIISYVILRKRNMLKKINEKVIG